MLDCLNSGMKKIEKIHSEYTEYTFSTPGSKTAFMSLVYPLFVQTQVISAIGNNINIHSDVVLMLGIAEYPDIYIPTYEEVIQHQTKVNEFINATKVLDSLLLPHIVKSNEFTYEKMREEERYMQDQNALVPTRTPAPTVLYLNDMKREQKKHDVKKEAKKPKFDDDGVSFFKNVGCLKK